MYAAFGPSQLSRSVNEEDMQSQYTRMILARRTQAWRHQRTHLGKKKCKYDWLTATTSTDFCDCLQSMADSPLSSATNSTLPRLRTAERMRNMFACSYNRTIVNTRTVFHEDCVFTQLTSSVKPTTSIALTRSSNWLLYLSCFVDTLSAPCWRKLKQEWCGFDQRLPQAYSGNTRGSKIN